ncbi:hypothetical protein ENUP19_0307G0008 [Entamoeba nuttalli]|uniref:cyclin-dependent kinase n=2 Tax=Entamoeba nuttalli TaxID=412467 RepID=K2HBG3_ENTNP|nr:cell division protein kinase, putative [Entamoeba nuttalli P19]EKE40004.1 cell division protein kinase, putative [Entamoeba nuttalli P19]|eukprot:XP_008857660.1 cell division protein kinase, putative [Entamoeba nuttalli P19]
MFASYLLKRRSTTQLIFDKYEKIETLGEGTYGFVSKVRNVHDKQYYALKMIKGENDSDGISSTSLREISSLLKLRHPFIIKLISVENKVDSLGMVFEYCECDLSKYIKNHSKIQPKVIKKWMKQLFSAIEYLHARRYLHRDLKPQNILIDKYCNIKLADFGLVRAVTIPLREYTTEIITLWYRPPEILLGATHYEASVDIWSIGAIFGELAYGAPIYRGESEYDELLKIFRVLGYPDEKEWPDFTYLKNRIRHRLPAFEKENLSQKFEVLNKSGINLFECCNQYNPTKRITARDALHHPYFSE